MRTPFRSAWIAVGSVVTVGLLLVYTGVFVSVLAREDERVVTSFPTGEVRLVDVRNANGDVEVIGRDVDEVTVTERVSHGLRPTRHHVGVVDGVLRLRSSCPWFSSWCTVHYRVVVPVDTALVADSRNGPVTVRDLAGDVRVDGANGAIDVIRTTGRLDLSTSNGSIEVADATGGVDASSSNGSIRLTGLRSTSVVAASRNGAVSMRFVAPPTTVRAESSNGAVTVELPDTEHLYRVELESSNGDTDTGVRTDPTGDRSVIARSANGSVAVRYAPG